MKSIKFVSAALVLAIAVSCTSNGAKSEAAAGADSTAVAQTVNPKSLLPTKAQKDSVSYLIGVNFGSFIKNYNFGEDLNYNLIRKGINDFLKAKGQYGDSTYNAQFKISPDKMNDLFNEYLSKRQEFTKADNLEKGKKFLAANKTKAGVVTTESGLQYIITKEGNDVKAGPADTVFVHYKGTLLDGTVFDESPKDGEGVKFTLDRVIKGWTEGMQLVGEGGSIRLFVPADLAYGEYGTQGIQPNSTLIFDVDVNKVLKVVIPEEPAEEKPAN